MIFDTQVHLFHAAVGTCLFLPTAKARSIQPVDGWFLDLVAETDLLYTVCTLHPDLPRVSE